jgi:hypothetical protein
MGGTGSGRWGSHSKKATVERCSTIPTSVLQDALAYSPGWRNVQRWFRGGEAVGSICYFAEPFAGGSGYG